MAHVSFVIGMFLFLIGDAASFVAASRYEPIFVFILICNLVGGLAIAFAVYRRPRWQITGLLVSLLAVYSTVDTGLRYCSGVRFLELFA